MKRCFKCGFLLPIDNFYRHKAMSDGHLNKCKECTKIDVKKNRDENIDYYQSFDRMRDNNPSRKEKRKEYAGTERGKIKLRDGSKAWVQRNPHKKAAYNSVSNAVRDGKLKKEPCSECGSEKSQAHHEDYSKPLDVKWLCIKCHADHHKSERNLPVLSEEELRSGNSKYISSIA